MLDLDRLNAWLTASLLCGDESMPQSVRAKVIAGSVSVAVVGKASMLCSNQAAERLAWSRNGDR